MAVAGPPLNSSDNSDSAFVEATPIDDANSSTSPLPIGPGPFPGIRHPLRTVLWLINVWIGLGFLLVLLSLVAAIPVLSLLALGYLLAAEAAVARSGRLRDGFPLLAVSSRIGIIFVVSGLFLLPVWLLAGQTEAHIVVTGRTASGGFLIGTRVLQVVIFLHLLLAIANGGAVNRFLLPFNRVPAWLVSSRRRIALLVLGVILMLIAILAAPALILVIYIPCLLLVPVRNIMSLWRGIRTGEYQKSVDFWTARLLDITRPVEHFWLALKAAAGAVAWLAVPTFLLSLSTIPFENPAPAALSSLLGGILLIPVAAWLPLLQAHQVTTGRFGAIFKVRVARTIIRRVPIRWALATILLYALAIPMYFTKIRLPADDAMWLITPVFILLTYPTRIIMGWVYASAAQREQSAWFATRWAARLFMIPVLGFYGLILFITPFISEAGRIAMFENHAFLLPIPTRFLLGG